MSEEKTRIVPRAASKEDAASITFQCGNGHRINVPAKLAGKRGTCSKCGVPVEPAPAPDAFAGLFDGGSAPEPAPAEEIVVDITGGAGEATSGGGSAVGDVVAGYGPEEFAAPDDGSAEEHPTAQLVARLWLEREHGGSVEIHVSGAAPIYPEWYEPRWSRGTHGLFAKQETDGTVTLTAVAWDSIQKIVVRGVQGLPDGMFE